jgi:hypothetical protein
VADTNITLTPSVAHTSGAATVTASAALFTANDVGRLISILQACNTTRAAATAYSGGRILVSEYNQVPRLYRVITGGTTAAAILAGTTPNYDLAAPNDTGLTVQDGTAVLRYLGPGRHVWGWALITGFTSATVVAVSVEPRGVFAATTASLRWRLGEFSNTRGWPRSATFHKGRFWLGGSSTRPQSLWASQSNDFENFAPTEPDGSVFDTNAISIALDADTVQAVRWLASVPRGLAVGTSSGEWLVAPANRNNALSPSNITADPHGSRGTGSGANPQRVSGPVLFPQRGGRRLRQLEYDYATDRFTTADLTTLADNIAGAGFLETAYADTPDGVFYGLRADGKIACLTFDTDQKLRAWSLWEMTGGTVESIAAVPDPNGTGTDLWCSVVRTVAGAEQRSIEFIRSPFRAELEDATDAFMLDSGLTYAGTPVISVTGLSHLEGQTVQVVADGSRRDNQVVASGVVAITGPAASRVHVGLPYRHRIVDLPPGGVLPNGAPLRTLTLRVVKAHLTLMDSLGGRVGGADDQGEDLAFRTIDMAMGEAVPLFTGERSVSTFGSWGSKGQVEIIGDDPFPFTLLAITKEISAS